MNRDSVRSDNSKIYRCLGLVGISVLIVFGTVSPIFTLAAFGAAAMQIVFGAEDYSWQMIFVMNSFSTIFKLSPKSTSLFTYIILLYDVILFLKHWSLPPLWPFFAIYLVAVPALTLQPSAFNILRWIKLLCGLLLAYYYFDDNASHDDIDIFLSFVFGFLGSSFTRLLNSDFFRIERFMDEINTVWDAGAEFTGKVRFAGLYNDPNFYTVNLIISFCLLVILLYQKKIPIPLFLVLAVILLYFDVSTYSKSAMLMLAVPAMTFVYAARKSERQSLYILLFGMTAAAIVFLVISGGGAFSIVLSRLSSGGGDLNKLTTGRTKIWLWTLEFFRDHPGWLLIGKGINGALINHRSHHNTYLEFPYHLGLIGTGLFFGLLRQIAPQHRPKKRNMMNYSVLICVLMMYMFLSALFFYDLPFQIILVFIVLNMELEQQVSVIS